MTISLGDGLTLEGDCVLKEGEAALETDVAFRTDLPKNHPLYGTRALRVVPAGMPDQVIKDGKMTSAEEAEISPLEEEIIR